jgi:hypothetical protein
MASQAFNANRPNGADPAHHLTHENAPKGYTMFRNKQDNCQKIVLKRQERRIH